jgi:hypothetical protein
MSNLPKASRIGLSAENILEDLKNKIKENPKYINNWNDFTSSNAGRMILELISYVIEEYGIRLDWIVNEFFLGTAQQKDSIINSLKLIAYQPRLAKESEVEIICELEAEVNQQFLMPYPFIIQTNDLDGNSINFELLIKNEDLKYNYPINNDGSDVVTPYFSLTDTFNPRINTLKFYEGSTTKQTYTCIGVEDELIPLQSTDIIDNSIRVWKKIYTIDSFYYKECLQVNSFLEPEAQEKEAFMPFKLELQSDETYGLRFSNKSIILNYQEYVDLTSDITIGWNEKLPIEGDELVIFYRVGGGEKGNITPFSINETRTVNVTFEERTIPITMSLKNEKSGIFGKNKETIEQAVISGPQSLSTLNRIVSVEDNKKIIEKLSPVLKSIHYSQQNRPDTIGFYGYGINSLETWHYIVPNIVGWNNRKSWEYQETFKFTGRQTEVVNKELVFSLGNKDIRLNLNPETSLSNPEYPNILIYSDELDILTSKYFLDNQIEGITELLFIGENDASKSNYEGNESSFEEINIKLTVDPIDQIGNEEVRWENITTEFIYVENLEFQSINGNSNLFTYELVDNTRVKFYFQIDQTFFQGNNLYLHYIYPKCYYKELDDGSYIKYIDLEDFPLYPNSLDNFYEIKITKNKADERTLLNIKNYLFENIDYSIEYSLLQKNIRIYLGSNLFNLSNISDFEPFYIHYIVDNSGYDLNLVNNTAITKVGINMVSKNDYSMQMTLSVNREKYIANLTNMSFYNILSSNLQIDSFTQQVRLYYYNLANITYTTLDKIDYKLLLKTDVNILNKHSFDYAIGQSAPTLPTTVYWNGGNVGIIRVINDYVYIDLISGTYPINGENIYTDIAESVLLMTLSSASFDNYHSETENIFSINSSTVVTGQVSIDKTTGLGTKYRISDPTNLPISGTKVYWAGGGEGTLSYYKSGLDIEFIYLDITAGPDPVATDDITDDTDPTPIVYTTIDAVVNYQELHVYIPGSLAFAEENSVIYYGDIYNYIYTSFFNEPFNKETFNPDPIPVYNLIKYSDLSELAVIRKNYNSGNYMLTEKKPSATILNGLIITDDTESTYAKITSYHSNSNFIVTDEILTDDSVKTGTIYYDDDINMYIKSEDEFLQYDVIQTTYSYAYIADIVQPVDYILTDVIETEDNVSGEIEVIDSDDNGEYIDVLNVDISETFQEGSIFYINEGLPTEKIGYIISKEGISDNNIVITESKFNNSHLNQLIKMRTGTLINQVAKIINVKSGYEIEINDPSFITGLTTSDSFDIITYPTGEKIAEFFNKAISSKYNPAIIRNNIKAYYPYISDSPETDRIVFMVRGYIPSFEEELTLEISNLDNIGTKLLGDNDLLSINTSLSVSSHENQENKVYSNTLEYYIYNQIKNKTMTCVEHVFKQPIFKSFDVFATVYYDPKFSSLTIEKNIKTSLRQRYNLVNMNFKENIQLSEVNKIIYTINGVKSVKIDYFGYDYGKYFENMNNLTYTRGYQLWKFYDSTTTTSTLIPPLMSSQTYTCSIIVNNKIINTNITIGLNWTLSDLIIALNSNVDFQGNVYFELITDGGEKYLKARSELYGNDSNIQFLSNNIFVHLTSISTPLFPINGVELAESASDDYKNELNTLYTEFDEICVISDDKYMEFATKDKVNQINGINITLLKDYN